MSVMIKRYGDKETMKVHENNGVTYLTFPELDKTGFVDHLSEDRQ